VPVHFFGSTSTISHFGERFRDGQYSLVSFLFAVLLLAVPPVHSHLFGIGATGEYDQLASDLAISAARVVSAETSVCVEPPS